MKDIIETIKTIVEKTSKDGITEAYNNIQSLLIENSLLSDDRIFLEEEIKNHRIKKLKQTNNLEEIFSRIVMHTDLNPAETMYGGRMLELCDEAGCVFIFKKVGATKIATTEMQNVFFKCSPKLGDIVTFSGEILEIGKVSIWVRILAKNITAKDSPVVIDTQMRFAFLDKLKK